jgi:phosphatidate cytidylyltransferase
MSDGGPLFGDDDRTPDPDEDPRTPPAQAGPPRAPAAEGEGVRIIGPDEAARRIEQGDAAPRRGGDVPRYGDRPAAPAPPSAPRARFPKAAGADPAGGERPRPRPGEPLITFEPTGDDAQLPPWTAPPTGEVPRVVAGGAEPSMSSGPRWRDEHERWADDDDLLADLAHDDDDDIGALDSRRSSSGTAGAFDDLDVPDAPGAAGAAGGRFDPAAPLSNVPPAARGQVGPTGRPAIPSGRSGGPARASQPGGPVPGDPSGGMVPPSATPRRGASARPGQVSGAGPAGPTTAGTGGRNMGQAVAVGVGLAVLGIVLAVLGAPWLLALVEVVVVLAGAEYLASLRRAGLEPPTLLGLAAIAALPLAAYARGDAAIPMVLFLLVVCSMVWFLAGAGVGRPVRDVGTMLLAVMHVGVLGAFAALILRLGPVGGSGVDQGVSFVLLAVVASVFYDVGGLFAGSRFGHTPLSSASPNKTREGLIGGLASSVVAVVLAVLLVGLTPLSFFQAVVFGVVCSAAAFLGDLSESLIKRDLGVKDMGNLLPGHGGVLDRFDGLLFVLPTAYYLILVLFA